MRTDYPEFDAKKVPAADRLPWIADDAGREAAAFPPGPDCGVRAAALVLGISYVEAQAALSAIDPTARDGTWHAAMDELLTAHGFVWHAASAPLTRSNLPDVSPLVVRLPRHLTAVIGGVIHDTGDPSRGGKRWMVGWWSRARLHP